MPRALVNHPTPPPLTPAVTESPPASPGHPGFAFDATFEGAVVPTKGAVKHAHDGARADVAPGAAPDDYEAELEAMGEREQTRELQELVSRHAA